MNPRLRNSIVREATGVGIFFGAITFTFILLFVHVGAWAGLVLLSLLVSLAGLGLAFRRDSDGTEDETGETPDETGETERDQAARLVSDPGAFIPGRPRD